MVGSQTTTAFVSHEAAHGPIIGETEMKTKHSVWVRLKVEADSKKEAHTIAERLMRVGMEHAKEVEPTSGEALKYWGLKNP